MKLATARPRAYDASMAAQPSASTEREPTIAALRDAFAREPVGLRLAYVFGSVARGEARAGSDLDVACLFERRPDFDDIARVERLVRRATGAAKVDVVPLEWASPPVRHDVIREGVLVYRRAVDDENDFEMRTIREFHDSHHLRAIRRVHLDRWLEEQRARRGTAWS